jgi:hypothetical protein
MIALLDDIVLMHEAGPSDDKAVGPVPPASTEAAALYARQRHDAHEMSVMRAFHFALRSRPRLLEAAAALLDECCFTETRSPLGRHLWTVSLGHGDAPETELTVLMLLEVHALPWRYLVIAVLSKHRYAFILLLYIM